MLTGSSDSDTTSEAEAEETEESLSGLRITGAGKIGLVVLLIKPASLSCSAAFSEEHTSADDSRSGFRGTGSGSLIASAPTKLASSFSFLTYLRLEEASGSIKCRRLGHEEELSSLLRKVLTIEGDSPLSHRQRFGLMLKDGDELFLVLRVLDWGLFCVELLSTEDEADSVVVINLVGSDTHLASCGSTESLFKSGEELVFFLLLSRLF